MRFSMSLFSTLVFTILISLNIYSQIVVGSQLWDKNNLSVTSFQNGDVILESRTPSEFNDLSRKGIPTYMTRSSYSQYSVCGYSSDFFKGRSNFDCQKIECGYVYNWFAVNDSRGLAPRGWRVASREDWKYLEKYYESKKGTRYFAWQLAVDGFLGGSFWTSNRVPGATSVSAYLKYFYFKPNTGAVVEEQQHNKQFGSWVRCVKNR